MIANLKSDHIRLSFSSADSTELVDSASSSTSSVGFGESGSGSSSGVGGGVTVSWTNACFSFSRSSLAETPLVPAVYKGWLPPPIVDDNRSEEAQQMCSFGKELTASIVSNEGWTFDESVEKPGMWANSSAARLTLALKVIPPAEALKVFHLQSWVADMGTATVECLSSSCSCPQTLLNGKGGSHSIMVPTDVPVQVSGAGECKLLLQGKTGSFKLMGVALAQLPHNYEGAGFEGGA
jgi:hypothetical protein